MFLGIHLCIIKEKSERKRAERKLKCPQEIVLSDVIAGWTRPEM